MLSFDPDASFYPEPSATTGGSLGPYVHRRHRFAAVTLAVRSCACGLMRQMITKLVKVPAGFGAVVAGTAAFGRF
jgi:hypothetical protein